MIEIKSVSKSYNGKKMVLKNISFKIESGEIFAPSDFTILNKNKCL